MDAALIYNVTRKPIRDWKHQIDLLVKAFKKAGINLCPVDNINAFSYVKKYMNYFDFVVFFDHDYLLAQEIEQLNIPTFNTSEAIKICSDKAQMYLKLRKARIPTPIHATLPFLNGESPRNYFPQIEEALFDSGLTYPFILRERQDSYDNKQFVVTSQLAFHKLLSINGNIPYIAEDPLSRLTGKGLTYRLMVIGKRVVAAMQVIYRGNATINLSNGEVLASTSDKEIDRGMKQIAVKAAHSVGAASCAVDISFNERGQALVTNIEVAPYYFLMSQVAGIDIELLLARFCRKQWKDATLALL